MNVSNEEKQSKLKSILLFIFTLFIIGPRSVSAQSCLDFYKDKKTTVKIVDAVFMDNLPDKIDIGTKVQFKLGHKDVSREGVFLGRLLDIDGNDQFTFFVQNEVPEMIVLPVSTVERIDSPAGRTLTARDFRVQLSGATQDRPLCAAFACFNAFRLLDQSGIWSNLELKNKMESTTSRVRELTTHIYELFIESGGPPRVVQVQKHLNQLARDVGLRAIHYSGRTNWSPKALSNIIVDLQKGWPVILVFNTSPQKVKAWNNLSVISTSGKQVDNFNQFAFYPNHTHQVNEGPHGAHAVVATGYVELNGRKYILISDPNQNYPLLWPISIFDRAFSADLHAWSIVP